MHSSTARINRLLVVSLVVCTTLLCFSVFAQVNRPWRNGSVWTLTFIKTKPGPMQTAYMYYLANDYTREQEALKSEGLTLSYKVLATESHNPQDWNLLLLTEYKDLATMEANAKKVTDVFQRVAGDDAKQMRDYKEREAIREIVGARVARDIIFPKQ